MPYLCGLGKKFSLHNVNYTKLERYIYSNACQGVILEKGGTKMIRVVGIAKTEELLKFEKMEDERIAAFIEVSKIIAKALQDSFSKLVMWVDEFHEAITYEKPKLPKTDFTRSRITHQTFDRKPRFAVRKILQ